MKAHRLFMALGAVALCAASVIALAVPEFHTLVATALAAPHLPSADILLAMPVALPALRTQLTDLQTRAKAKKAEIREGLTDEQVRAIETEHEALIRQAEEVQAQIATAEAEERTGNPPGNTQANPQVSQAVREAQAAERARAASIRDIGRRAGMTDEVVTRAVDDGTDVETFRARAFDEMTARQTATPTSGITITRDEQDSRRAGMRDAIVARMARAAGDRNVQIPEHARAFGEMGFAEMAAEVIGHRGHLRTARQVDQVFARAFHSTSDFPGIFSDALNVRLLARYLAATPTYRLFSARYNANDFRAQNVVRAGDFPTLQPILETGEIKAGTWGESKEQLTVSPYGVRFGISRQMIVNDNLGAIDQVIGSSSDRVTDWENGIVFTALLQSSNAGPTLLTDGKRMFHADHGNHVTSGTAIAVPSVGLGRAAMAKQTSLDGLKLNLRPSIILTGPDRATEAEQLTTQITPATMGTVVPDWMRRLAAASDANITGNHWYLFADPSVAPTMVYGSLDGYEGPRLSTNDPFTVQGIEVKLEHDFGAAGVDYRGAYHNAGAAPT